MSPVIAVAAAAVLFMAALVLVFTNREEKAVRNRVLLQSGRGTVQTTRSEERSLIARPAARRGILAQISTWLGLAPGMLPLRRIPLPLVLVMAGAVGGGVAWMGNLFVAQGAGLPLGFGGAILAIRAAYMWELGQHRDAAFKQIPDAIGLMVRAVRAGLPIGEAMRSVAREMPDPTRSEFQRLLGETGIGTPLDKALWGVFERTGLREYAFLSVVVGLQAQTGGGLAEALDNIGDIVRKRVAMAAKARALASQARASAAILVALPPFAGTAVSIARPGYLALLFNDPRGIDMITIAIGMLLFGMLVIRTMIRRATAE